MTESSFDSGAAAPREEKLDEARETLIRQLEEACRVTTDGNAPETTGELRKLDDALLAAARTTEEMIALRSQRRAARGTALADAATLERIREFTDTTGVRWRVWAVTPGQAISTSPRNHADLHDGWLAFESLDTGAKRRLAHFPADWATSSDAELERLLGTAAPARKRGGGEAAASD